MNRFGIVAIIAGLVFLAIVITSMSLRGKKSAEVRENILELVRALRSYRVDTGVYPTSEQGLRALVQKPYALAESADWQGPYIEEKLLLDPWGNEFYYAYPGKLEVFDLISYGFDGVKSDDDVKVIPAIKRHAYLASQGVR